MCHVCYKKNHNDLNNYDKNKAKNVCGYIDCIGDDGNSNFSL